MHFKCFVQSRQLVVSTHLCIHSEWGHDPKTSSTLKHYMLAQGRSYCLWPLYDPWSALSRPAAISIKKASLRPPRVAHVSEKERRKCSNGVILWLTLQTHTQTDRHSHTRTPNVIHITYIHIQTMWQALHEEHKHGELPSIQDASTKPRLKECNQLLNIYTNPYNNNNNNNSTYILTQINLPL